MNHKFAFFQNAAALSIYGGGIALLLGTVSPSAQATAITPSAAAITYGTEISGSYYHGLVNYNNWYVTPPNAGPPAGSAIYTNQVVSQSDTIAGHSLSYINGNYVPNPPDGSSASSTASLSTNQLGINLQSAPADSTGAQTQVFATAEMWDTLTVSGLPTGISANTVIGTLSMSVHSTGTPNNSLNQNLINQTISLLLINTGNFSPATWVSGGTVYDCAASGSTSIGNCGVFASSDNGYYGPTPSANMTYSLNLTYGNLSGGQFAYIASVAGEANLGAFLNIDPAITFTGADGAQITSMSGANYTPNSPPPVGVPEPATIALFGFGLAAIGFTRRRKAS